MHEVHLWVAELDPPPEECARRFAATTAAERERASRFWRRRDGDRYLSAHGALRRLLAHYVGGDPLDLRFETEAHGKPRLVGTPLQFNLSHSSDLALIAVSRDRRVGVDVEQLRPVQDLDALAPRVCSPDELVTLRTLAEPQRDYAFLAMWTRKEALAKATGEGIGGVMRDGSGPSAVADAAAGAPDGWTVMELDDLPGYAACIAAEGSGWQLVRRNVTASTERR